MKNTMRGLGLILGVFCFSGWVFAEELLVSINEGAISTLVSSDGAVSFSAGSSEIDWLSEAGEPEIPWKFMRVLLPPNVDLSTVSCALVDDEWSGVEGVANILPAMPRMQSIDENQNMVEVWPVDRTIVDGRDVAIYGTDAFWLGSAERCSGTGNLQGWKLAEVAVPLARYNPVQGQLEMLGQARLEICYETQKVLVAPNQSVVKRVRDLVVNFDEMAANYLPLKSVASRVLTGGNGYLIAASKDVQAASTKLAAFIAHKQSLGFTVTVIDEDDTGGATAGTGAPSMIKFREWLQANYSPSDLRYLLIIADPRTDQANSYFPMGRYNDSIPTDYFYAELTCDWDTDLDGVWGEDSEWDRYFELYVGRIPYYGTIADTDSILQKTIDYETSTDVAWRRRGLISACPLQISDVNRHYYDWAEQIKADLFEPQAIPTDRLYKDGNKYTVSEWAAANQIDPPPEYPTKTALNLQWRSTPYGVVALNSHGGSSVVWEIISADDVRYLMDDRPATVFLGACSTATPEAVNNITYAMLKNGAITTVGATRTSYLWFSHFADSAGYPGMSYRYQKGVLAHQSCGESFWSLKEETTDYWTSNWSIYNLYGDPSVKVFPVDNRPDFTVLPTHRFYGLRYASSPYSLTSRTYTFVNDSAVAIDWTASKSASWFDLSATSGTIPANSTATIEVTMNSAVESFVMGQQLASFTVTDTTHSISYDRGVEFEYKHAQIFRHNQYVFQGADGAATSFGYENSFDRHMDTVWNATNTVDHLPEYQLDLRMPYELTGFVYTGGDSTSTGRIRSYEFYTSMDGTNWGIRVATGIFANSADAQEILFDTVYARYVRLVALSIEGGGDVAKLNDLKIYHRWDDRGLRSRLYADISGSAVSDLTSDSQYPNYAVIHSIRPTFEGDHNRDEIYEGYGARYDGFIVPPTTGNYTFWVASDDAGQLWLSSDATTNNLSMIASLSGYTSFHEWTKYTSQQSSTIALTAGVPYAVMGMHKEGSGGDHYAVAWEGSGFARQIIATPFLSYEEPVLSASSPVVNDQSFTVFEDAALGATIGTLVATDADAEDLLRYHITGGNEENRFAIHPTSGVISVVAALDAVATTDYSLVVVVVDESGNNDLAIIDVSVLQDSVIIPPGNLIVHYQFNEATGTTVFDAAGGDHSGTLSGGTWQPTEGVHGGALYMDGTNDLINIGDSSEINLSTVTNRTIAIWFRADALAGQGKQMLFEEGDSTHGINLYLEDDVLYMNAWDGGTYIQTNGLNTSQWYHAALTIDSSSGMMRGYLDGVEFAQASCNSISAHNGDIGMGYVNGNTKTHDVSSFDAVSYFAGNLDDFVLYNRTLSASEIVDLTYVNSPPVASNATFSIDENSESGSVVGTVSASDDPQDTFSIVITAGNDDGLFSIHPISGLITVIGDLDHETTASYSLIITVTDSGELTDTATISISVTDVPNDDSDADGLNDDWEATHFGSTTAQDASGDPDSDGVNNLQEENLGSDPNDAAFPSAEYANLCGWWKLNDLTGTTALDSSGNGNNGLLSGGNWVDGIEAGALDFVATNKNSVEIPAAAFSSIDTEVSFVVWVYGNVALQPQESTMLRASDASGNRVFSVHIPWVSTIYWDAGNSGSSFDRIYKSATVDEIAGRWNHWVFTKNATTGDMKIYLNGQLWHSGSGKTETISGIVSAHIGSEFGTGCFYDGTLDDIRLYNRVLTDTEVLDLYHQNVSPRVYLSDINWVSQTVGWGGSVKKDLSIDSNPITLDEIIYPKGLGAHAQSEIVYNLAGNYVTFHSIVGIDDEVDLRGSVIFKVYGDDVLLYETAVITAIGTVTLDIDVTGVQTLKLVADDDEDNGSDHADWADAYILLDNDADGLADEWEITYFGDITAQDGAGDPDNDGITNKQEHDARTDPTNPNNYPFMFMISGMKSNSPPPNYLIPPFRAISLI